MAGMFYSLQEAAEQLGMTEKEVKQLAKEGKLREFRDGSNVMYKVDEVSGLKAQPDLEASAGADEMEDLLDLEPPAESGDQAAEVDDDLKFLEDETLALEPETSDETPPADEDLDALLGFAEEGQPQEEAREPAMEAASEDLGAPAEDLQLEDDLGLVEPELDIAQTAGEPALDFGDTQKVPEIQDAAALDDDSLLLADTGEAAGDLGGDTALTGSEGISVLGETDGDFKLTDDTMAETLAGLGATGETSLEEIEDDLSLDSVGSGSGLLDLSLQADDTSLGGILDEIYTSDGEGQGPAKDTVGTTEEMVAESETLPVDAGIGVEDGFVPMTTPVMMASAAEIPADESSRMLGGLLFIPVFVLLYTAVIAVAGMRGVLPSALSVIQGFIWYVLGGVLVVALIVAAMGFTKGGGPKPAKEKKAKAAKTPKAKKEKQPKAEKPKKEKKPLFGKKK